MLLSRLLPPSGRTACQRFLLPQCPALGSRCRSPRYSSDASDASDGGGGLLSDVRILDLTRVLAGPFCTQFLADLGAEVIKVERPGKGDETRAFGPPFFSADPGDPAAAQQAATYYFSVNRNKQSIALDLKKGHEVVKQLVAQSDVLIENFIPGVMDRLGLGFDQMRQVNPHLIYCSISGFGSDDRRPGYDVIASSVAGLLSVTGPTDGEPCRPGVPVVDIITGLYASNAILAAIVQRRKQERRQQGSGTAVKIEVDLISSQVSILINLALNYLNFGHVTPRRGSAHDSIVPYQAFACKPVGPDTDWITVGAGSDAMFEKLVRTLFSDPGREQEQGAEMLADARFAHNADRVQHRAELIGLLQQQFRTRTQQQWLPHFQGKGFSFGPVNRLDQVFADPRILSRNVFTVPGPDGKPIHLLRNAVRFISQQDDGGGSFFRPDTKIPAIRVGEDTEQVLRSLLRMSPQQISALRDANIIQTAS